MRRRFDLVELVMIAGFCTFAGAYAVVAWHSYFDEMRPYRLRYGSHVSHNGEEWLIRDFFQDRRGGVFVDVGANHYRDGSNTYFLETALGWSGVAIEPQPQFAGDYERFRPATRFLQAFVSDRPGTVPLFVPSDPDHHGVASFDQAYALNAGGETTTIQTPAATLDQILEQVGIDRFDFLTMDIERHEPQALAGFSIGRYRPTLVCIEAHQPTRQPILDYFARNAYVLVGKYLRADRLNLWFTPLNP